MKNRLNINNNFATVRRGRRDLRVRRTRRRHHRRIGGTRLAKPLTSSAASLQAAAPVNCARAAADRIRRATRRRSLLEHRIARGRSAERFNIAL